MRKITFILGLCCILFAIQSNAQNYTSSGTPISSAAELTTGRYLISVYSNSKEGLLYWNDAGYHLYVSSTAASSKTGSLDPTSTDGNYMWDIVKAEDGSFTIQSVKSGKYTSKRGANGEGIHNTQTTDAGNDNIGTYAISSPVTISSIPHFTIKMTNGTFNGAGNTTYFHCNGNTLGTSGESMHLSYWEGENVSTGNYSCVKMAFYPLISEANRISLTYDYQMNGVSVKTETVEASIDADFPDITLPYLCTASKPAGTATAEDEGTTKIINVTWNGPFEYSSTVDDAIWYQLTLHRHNFVMKNNSATQVSVIGSKGNGTENVGTLKNFTLDKNEHWAFVGDPFNGFQMYSRVGGRIVSATAASSTPFVSTADLTSSQVDKWIIIEQGLHTEWGDYTLENGFSAHLKGYPNLILNFSETYHRLQYWENNKDNGSTFIAWKDKLPSRTLNAFDGKTYASFYADYPVEVTSANVKVYTGTVSGTALNMTEAADKIIPAGVGVVLVGDAADVTTAALSIANTDGKLAKGSIEGTTSNLEITGLQDRYLVLGVSNEAPQSIGFFCPATSVTSIPAYKAYIPLRVGSVRGFNFNFDGTATAIDNATSGTEKAQTIYDLSGRRVSKAGKGIYIMGGKKIYVK